MAKKKTSRTKTTARKSPRGKKATSTKKKSSARPRRESNAQSPEPSAAGEMEVTIDRRRNSGRRAEDAARSAAGPSVPPLERRQKVNRRRQIDPTTCERDYSDEEVEFMNALDEYKRKNGRMFPTCSEVLEVIRDLGYVKSHPATLAGARQPGPVEALEKAAT